MAGKIKVSFIVIAALLGVWLVTPVETQSAALQLIYGNNGGTIRPIAIDASGGVDASSDKLEDAAHTTADRMVPILGVRKDAAAQTTGADGDYSFVAVDAYGASFSRSDHPNRIRCNVTTSTATTLTALGGSCAAPGAGLSIYITDILFSASAAGIAADAHPTLKEGTGGTCGAGTAIVWQALTAAAIVVQDNRTVPIKLTANTELCWMSSTAGSKALVVSGYIAP